MGFNLHLRSEKVDRKQLIEMGHVYRDHLFGLLGDAAPDDLSDALRVWTDLSGRTIEASLVIYDETAGTITLRRKDGQVFRGLAVANFSQADKDFLSSEKARAASKPTAP